MFIYLDIPKIYLYTKSKCLSWVKALKSRDRIGHRHAFCSFDLDLERMTLISNFDVDRLFGKCACILK